MWSLHSRYLTIGPFGCVFKENLALFPEYWWCSVARPIPRTAPFLLKGKLYLRNLISSPLLIFVLFYIKQVQLGLRGCWFFFFSLFFLLLLTSPDGYAIHRLKCVQIMKLQRPPCLRRVHMFRHCCSLCGSTERVEKSNRGTCISYLVQVRMFLSFLLVMRGGEGDHGHLWDDCFLL